MSRDLDPALKAAATASVVKPLIMAELSFDSDPVRLWTGYGLLTWGDRSFIGGGTLVGVSRMEETAETRAVGLEMSLSGVSTDIVALALAENYQGRLATVWLGALDETTGQLVSDPYQLFRGRMDLMEIEVSGETARVTLSVESILADLERKREFRYTDQSHKALFPSDKGFEFVAGLVNKSIVWGQNEVK